MIRILSLIVLGIAMLFASTVNLEAQTNPACYTTVSCGIYSLWWGACVPPLPSGATNCFGFAWTEYCQVPTPFCVPYDAPNETICIPCLLAAGAGKVITAANPVSLSTGDTWISHTDVNLPGLGGGLKFTRTWNSIWPTTQARMQIGVFGSNWRSTYEESVYMGHNNYLKYCRSDGTFWSFGYLNGYWVPAAPAIESADIIQGATTWNLTFQSGEKRTFDLTTGHLLSIVDRNGNTTQLTYDGSNRLTTITDPVGRQLILGYASPSSFFVTGITSTVSGITFTYTYDAQNRLIQVTRPDLTTLNYTYNTLSQITSVTDMNGKVLESHTYDTSGRGLTAAGANGVQAVTLSY